MWNGERPLASRLGRTLITVVGVLGAFAVLDALLIFLALLIIPVFGGSQNPYIGLLLVVVLPVAAILGGALAWTAYAILSEQGAPGEAGEPRLRV